ncbi:MAG: TonB-dependent receptor [Burkholderiales bacterium]|nr:TonB-dependent receptor [Phycisphaerae bacterium]
MVLRSISSCVVGGALALAAATALGADEDLTALSIEDLMNVEVTSVSKSSQRVADAPAAISVITQEDIARSGLHDIPEMLRLVPGMFVQRGNHLTGWSVTSRGFADQFANKLLVLQDGRTLYTPYFSGVYWNTVDYPIADLDRIEVIRGPGASLWGSNAVNGVINITTKTAKETQGGLIESRIGTGSSDLALRYGGQLDDQTHYRVYMKGRAFDDLQGLNEVGDQNQWQHSRGGFRVDHAIDEKNMFTIQGDAYYQSMSNGVTVGIVEPGYTHDYHSGANLLARLTHVESKSSETSLQMYYDRVNLRDPHLEYHLDTIDFDFQQRFAASSRHDLTYGLGLRFQYDTVGSERLDIPMVDPDSRTTYLASAFIQDTITLAPDRLKLVLGSKFEMNSFTGFEIQPSGRLIWTPDEKTSLWGAISRSVRTPGRWQEDSNLQDSSPAASIVITSAHPDSEILWAHELGYRHEFNKSFSLDITGFYNNYDKLIGEQTTSAGLEGAPPRFVVRNQFANAQHAEVFGAEVAAIWQVNERWKLRGSYSHLLAYVHNDLDNLGASDADMEQSYPQHQFQIHSYFDITKTLKLNTSLYFVDATGGGTIAGSPGPEINSYYRGDINVMWQPQPGLDVSVGVQGAFDANHLEAPYNSGTSAEANSSAYAQVTWKF